MKNKLNIRSFVLGIATTLLISTLAFTALAATNMIEIKPVRIMVSGEMFVPKDVNGKEVPVFTYEGTTYAPLRALGEAFGQKIGYDADKKIATVGEVPAEETGNDEPSGVDTYILQNRGEYNRFKSIWDIVKTDKIEDGLTVYSAKYNGALSEKEFAEEMTFSFEGTDFFAMEWARETFEQNNQKGVRISFYYKDIPTGSVVRSAGRLTSGGVSVYKFLLKYKMLN